MKKLRGFEMFVLIEIQPVLEKSALDTNVHVGLADTILQHLLELVPTCIIPQVKRLRLQ